MLKDFLASNDNAATGQATGNGEDDDIYTDGADLGLTQRFLERKRKLQETNQGTQLKKEVDRKASKQRKIRYIVHEKLVNFMTPQDNLAYLDDASHSILLTLFGQTMKKSAAAEEVVQVGKKRTQRGDEDDIQLI